MMACQYGKSVISAFRALPNDCFVNSPRSLNW
jgi:hypothetical protein